MIITKPRCRQTIPWWLMINKKIFFKGYKSILAHDSPAIALGCCFIAIGALLKNLGFNIQESIFSTMLTYALPGSLVMAESLLSWSITC